jgi:hypothetical protein
MTKRLPRRPRAHVLETLSRQHVEGVFPPEWVCRRVEDDYGLDMRVEIVADEEVTGLEFSVQLKATDRLKISGNDVLHRCDVSTAQYFLHRSELVMYVVYDAQGEVAYWLWVQPYLRRLDETRAGWRDHKTVQIHIPHANRLTPEGISAIADYVRAWQTRVTPAVGWEYAPSPQEACRPFQPPPDLPTFAEDGRMNEYMKAFISHSSKDKEFTLRLATDLRTRAGIDAWLDQWEINPGDRIPERIEEGLSEADVFILVLSPDSVNSQWVEYERQAWLTMQIDEEKRAREVSRPPTRRLIPVLHRDCQKPAFLQPIHHVRITDQDYEDGFKQLVSAILGVSKKPPLKKEISPAVVPEPGVPRRKYVLTLLKGFLPSQFEEVVFTYDMPHAYLPTNVSQVEKAIAVIRYALQQEGENISKLLDTIYTVAPHFRGGH